MSIHPHLYQPQLSSFYSLAVYCFYAIVLVGFGLMVSRAAITLETFGLGLLVLAVICFAVYIRYQALIVNQDSLRITSSGFNPLDLILPRTMRLDEITHVNAVRMLPKDLRGPKAIPTYIEFVDLNGKTMMFNRWNYQPKEITTFLQSLAKVHPEVVFNEDIQALVTGSY